MHHAFSKLFAVVLPAIKWKRGRGGRWEMENWEMAARLATAERVYTKIYVFNW